MILPTTAEARKFIAAGCGVIAQAIAIGLVHGPLLHYLQLALAAATALGVYAVPNQKSAASEKPGGTSGIGEPVNVAPTPRVTTSKGHS